MKVIVNSDMTGHLDLIPSFRTDKVGVTKKNVGRSSSVHIRRCRLDDDDDDDKAWEEEEEDDDDDDLLHSVCLDEI